MKQQHHIDRDHKVTTRAVKGRPGVREVIGGYRPVEWGVGGPYVLDDGPNGGRESPKMTEPMKYLGGDEHLRILTGNPHATMRDGVFASSPGQDARSKGRQRGA
jgi:hypothetical protein